MDQRQGIALLIVCFCVVYVNCDYNFLSSEKPRILNTEFESILEVGDNFSVSCQGNRPLTWTVPEVPEDKKLWTTFVTSTVSDSKYPYELRLDIYNMSYPFVGFYYCHYNDSDKEDRTKSDKIYLFVNDLNHLTTANTDGDIEEVFVTIGQVAIIPCKPTSPDVKVNLTHYSGISDMENIDYDPKIGFSIFITDLSQQQVYECSYIRDSNTESNFVNLIIDFSLPVSHIATPHLRDLNEGHTVVGEDIHLQCIVKTSNDVRLNWETPNEPLNISDPRYMLSEPRQISDKRVQNLTIYNSKLSDNGTYLCKVADRQKHTSFNSLHVQVYGPQDVVLIVKEENDINSITKAAGEPSVQWVLDVIGHPRPKVTWLNNHNETIPLMAGDKYEAYYNSSYNRAFLKIKNIEISDFGNYTLLASNGKNASLSLLLNVTDKPTVVLAADEFQLVNKNSTIKCIASAYPEPEFHWFVKPCLSNTCDFIKMEANETKNEGFQYTSELTMLATKSGYIKCFARNSIGTDETTKQFYVSDVKNGFDLYFEESGVDVNIDKKVATIAENDTVTAICRASKEKYSNIIWIYPTKGDKYDVMRSDTIYSTKLQLKIKNVQYSDRGLLSCRVNDQNGAYHYRNITLRIERPTAPSIVKTNLQDIKAIDYPHNISMLCRVSGIPKPVLQWYKNNVIFSPMEPERIIVSDNKEEIMFKATKIGDQGIYECRATNSKGIVSKRQKLVLKNLPQTVAQLWLIAIIVFLAILFIIAMIFIFIKVRKERQLQKELKSLGLTNFVKGAVENINPELGVDDQAELLPYDQKWEFPIERLKLGKQLGSGAFGVVMKGVAKNIIDEEAETTVAVKMVKKNADQTYIRALASELKIMVHLGKHLNVVNLLGACTKNVAKRELLVIVEFCRFGNLQNYLLRHRDNYIDQVDPKTGKIDYVIGQEFFDRTYSVSSDRSNTQSPSLKYAALTFSNSSNQTVLPPPSNMGDYRANTEMTMTTDMTTVSQGEDGVILSNNSVQPEWRSNYKGDYKGNVQPICTKDLLAWAFQVARGMEYLASRKVLHGDLAARNILLADNNVVKICDFGLAKSMYKNDNYKKRGDGPLPVKWMAIESIRDRVFSTQSDVWSFGIVLWEFFSLAKTPYPGMEADEKLYQKLLDGYRMESPKYAPKAIYQMMTECWSPKPLARPSFTRLSERLGGLLEDSMRKHYIDLNDPYLVMNNYRFENGQSDYLAMLSPPTFEALSSPHYLNEEVGKESLEDSGYLSMKPNTIFSPRVEDAPMFDFNVSNRKHLNSEEGNTMELLPMLRQSSDSGCDTPLQSPATPNSFSNPSYHVPPKIEEEYESNNTNIVNSADNYVNMPHNKSIIKEKTTNQINPFVTSMADNAKDHHYVNSNTKDWQSIQV